MHFLRKFRKINKVAISGTVFPLYRITEEKYLTDKFTRKTFHVSNNLFKKEFNKSY